MPPWCASSGCLQRLTCDPRLHLPTAPGAVETGYAIAVAFRQAAPACNAITGCFNPWCSLAGLKSRHQLILPFHPAHLNPSPSPPPPSLHSDALAYDRATCDKTCKSSEFALATAQALAEAVDKCGCDAAATSLAIVSTIAGCGCSRFLCSLCWGRAG